MRKEKTVDFHIKWAWHAISKMYNNHSAKFGMTMATSYILLNIDLDGGTPATKIGPALGMEPRSLVRTLSALEEKGLITKEVSPNDKRLVQVFLTPEGKEKRERAREGVISFNNFLREQIPLGKLAVFFEVIESIKTLVESENQRLRADKSKLAISSKT